MRGLSLPLLLAALLAGSALAADHQYTVNSTADAVDANPGDGICATALDECTLRAAVMEGNHASPTDTVEILVPGNANPYVLTIFPSGIDDETTGNLNVDHAMTITGGGAARTIIDGNGADNVFAIATGNYSGVGGVTLADLTIRNGVTIHGGGGVYATQHVGTLALTRCLVTANSAAAGGGISTEAITTIDRCTISRNDATSDDGGGIASYNSLTLADSTVSDNTAPLSGAGVYALGGQSLTIFYSTISGNTVGTFGSNITPTGGGLSGGYVTTTNVTGTIIVNFAWMPSPPYSTLEYSDCTGTFAGNLNLVNDKTGCTITAAVADPMLADLHSNGGPVPTRALLAGSPAIDTGSPTSCAYGTPTDARGAHRPEGAGCDLGAYEFDANGDVDGDGARNVADVFTPINFLFANGPAPTGLGDVNGDSLTNVSDVFYLINFLFAGGPAPL